MFSGFAAVTRAELCKRWDAEQYVPASSEWSLTRKLATITLEQAPVNGPYR